MCVRCVSTGRASGLQAGLAVLHVAECESQLSPSPQTCDGQLAGGVSSQVCPGLPDRPVDLPDQQKEAFPVSHLYPHARLQAVGRGGEHSLMQGRDLHPPEFWEERGEGTPSCYPERTKPPHAPPRGRGPLATALQAGRKCSSSCAGHFLLWEAPWGPSESPQLQFPACPESNCSFLQSTALTH